MSVCLFVNRDIFAQKRVQHVHQAIAREDRVLIIKLQPTSIVEAMRFNITEGLRHSSQQL